MTKRSGRLVSRVVWAACLAAGCGQHYSDKPAAEALAERNLTPLEELPSVPPPEAGESPVQTLDGGVTIRVPEAWQRVPPSSSMRIAEYAAPFPEGGEGATLAVFKGNMGSVDANVQRWFGQFTQADGSPARGRRWTLETEGGLRATMVDVSGTFRDGMGMGEAPLREGYRMLGAILEAGGTTWYLKFTGTGRAVSAHEEGFDSLVRSMRN